MNLFKKKVLSSKCTLAGLAICCSLWSSVAVGQTQSHARPSLSTALGDAPADPGPRTTLSPAMTPKAVKEILSLVATREWKRTAEAPSQDWTMVPLYLGLLSASQTLHDPRFHDEVLAHANGFGWKLGPRTSHADDQAIGQVYLDLYKEDRQPDRIESMLAQFNRLLEEPSLTDSSRPVWWWCDALFMAPSAWSGLSLATKDKRYAEYADRQWQVTDKLLWNEKDHLFSRDATFLDKHETNGELIYWARGNGWVMAGLARELDSLPAGDPRRQFYVHRLQQMSERIAPLQGADGLWRPGLLDAAHYPLPETSGSAFFVYALAWGVNHRVLSASVYRPVIRKAWAGLVSQTYADGRLGSVQPIGAAPGAYTASASYVFGSGAMLLAGSEVAKLK